jgi:hypothetical protein
MQDHIDSPKIYMKLVSNLFARPVLLLNCNIVGLAPITLTVARQSEIKARIIRRLSASSLINRISGGRALVSLESRS